MIFRPFLDFEHGCAAYVFGCGGQGLCAVVDARAPEIGDYVAFGAGLSGKPSSTIGFEKRFNRALSLDREAFVDAVAVVAPKPADADSILEFNRGNSDR